jgi:hypothetical protein
MRCGFRYSAIHDVWENEMILEDLQHRFEGLKQRISLVRSYL